MNGAAANRFGVVQEHGIVFGRIEAASPIEVGHRVLLALREIFRAKEAALLDHDDVPAAFSQIAAERAATRAGADDDDVGALPHIALLIRALNNHAISPKSTGLI